jgi:hypothetical protein
MTRANAIAALILSSSMAAASAHADLVVPHPNVRVILDLSLAMVTASAHGDAPAEDVERVERAIRDQLVRARPRVQRCLRNVDLREDPLRNRARRIELRMVLDRSGRPERVWVQHDQGMPRGARRCLLEPARAVNVHPAPRGGVLVRIVYELAS